MLQDGRFRPVGSKRELSSDFRLLAATNRDLAEAVRRGRFRADLYHRLSVYPLQVPPLRERGRDPLLLAGYFLEQNRLRLRLRGLRLSADAQAALLRHDWPGNVRELEHLLGRAALKALARRTPRPAILTLEVMDLGLESPAPTAMPTDATPPSLSRTAIDPDLPLRHQVDAFQRERIRAALQQHQGNWAAAARALGLHAANLHRLAERLGLKPRAD